MHHEGEIGRSIRCGVSFCNPPPSLHPSYRRGGQPASGNKRTYCAASRVCGNINTGAREFSALWSDKTYDYTIRERIEKFRSSRDHRGLFITVSRVFLIAKRLEKLYKKFPSSIDRFESWMSKRTRLYGRLFKVLGLKRGISS
ncbi:MAG: hypothetical protein JW885_11680 [Deltaproteobacteria bacterium]|nr:hypothetical protein [Candidatus Zymogenaceae bacterium]